MTSWVVMSPPSAEDAPPEFVRDRFSLWAFLAPPLWFGWNRMWLEMVVAGLVMLLLPAIAVRLGFGTASPFLSLLVSVYAGLESATLKLAALRREGWRDAGVYEADDLFEAETRYADAPLSGPWGTA